LRRVKNELTTRGKEIRGGVQMNVLIACECSGKVRDAFIKKGHKAMSCDLKPTDRPGPHYEGSVFDIIDNGWDMMIAFPPCTHLAVSGARHFKEKIADGRQKQGIDFFMAMVNAKIEKIAIENPIGIMSNLYREPDQIIHPYYFGDPFQKSTCLWLKNLKKLYHLSEDTMFEKKTWTDDKGEFIEWIDKKTGKTKKQSKWFADALKLKPEERSSVRSETFDGIANAMANQWG
jgi:hypothetical protein